MTRLVLWWKRLWCRHHHVSIRVAFHPLSPRERLMTCAVCGKEWRP